LQYTKYLPIELSRKDNSVVDWITPSVAEVTGGPKKYKTLNNNNFHNSAKA